MSTPILLGISLLKKENKALHNIAEIIKIDSIVKTTTRFGAIRKSWKNSSHISLEEIGKDSLSVNGITKPEIKKSNTLNGIAFNDVFIYEASSFRAKKSKKINGSRVTISLYYRY